MKVLFCAFEAAPFAKTGGLGDVAGSLPAALKTDASCDCRVVLPLLGCIPDSFRSQLSHLCDFYIDLAWRHQYVGVEALEYNGVTHYFIDNEYYFKRANVYGYGDDPERAAFFSKAVLEALPLIGFAPDIIHCNDWHTALVPVFLKASRLGLNGCSFPEAKSVFTIHNLKFQGVIPSFDAGDLLALSYDECSQLGLTHKNTLNFMRGGISSADYITTVSPTYANEICTPAFGEGCQELFQARQDRLSGILNGIDYSQWPLPFSSGSPAAGKAAARAALQEELGLEKDPSLPVYAIISRLTDQKGLDLVNEIIWQFMERPAELVVLGVGEPVYENTFRALAGRFPGRVSANILFDVGLSKRIYAGADFILVPSLFEPCGLSQIIGMHHGTLPIVRKTGGLADTVNPDTGYVFENYSSAELLGCLELSLKNFATPLHTEMVINALAADFSWNASARAYLDIYRKLLDA